VLNPAIFGQLRTAGANQQIAELEVKRLLEQVAAQIVAALEDSSTDAQLITLAKQQESAAQDALRIMQENFEIGTALFLDVLQAQDAFNQARLNQATAITSYNQAQVNLLMALGLIDQAKVAGAAKARAAH
jgi:outer membrane protein TolC